MFLWGILAGYLINYSCIQAQDEKTLDALVEDVLKPLDTAGKSGDVPDLEKSAGDAELEKSAGDSDLEKAADNSEEDGTDASGKAMRPSRGRKNRNKVQSGLPGIEQCTCVPYYLCNNGTINTNGAGIIDIRVHEGACSSYLEVCCNERNLEEEPITPPPPQESQVRKGCGYRHPDGVGFRIKGDRENEAQFGEFPWMVAVLRQESVDTNHQTSQINMYQCGGALIHPQVVVTGAHCVHGENHTLKIRAGEWDTQTTQEIFPHQDREVDYIAVHPEYYGGALFNDIALLFLKSPVVISQHVEVVCLPPQDTEIDSERCFATGWGKDVFGKAGNYQVILKKIDLPIVPRDTCQAKLRATRLGEFFELHESFVCAGGEPEKDTCTGDGGSPLVCPIKGQSDRYYQAGIVAWGIGCGHETPGVYANVAMFRDWIDEEMKLSELDISSYQY